MSNPTKLSAMIPTTREILAGAALGREVIEEAWDRFLRPWRYPDPPALRTVDPLPELTSVAHRWRALRDRLSDIAYVARYGMPEDDR